MPKEHRIEVVTGSYDSWIKLIDKNLLFREIKEVDKLVIDFRSTRFLEPLHLVSLACLIEQYHQADIEIGFIKGRFNIDKYVSNLGFYDYWTPGFDRGVLAEPRIETALPLWKISNVMIHGYAHQAQLYFERNHFTGKNLDALAIALPELFNNIYDHAKSLVDGYVITQYYPRKDEIVISVCDFGKGIPNKVNEIWHEHNKPRISDEDALRAAFIRHLSSKSNPRNKGFGLANLYDNVKALKGEILIYSNKAVLRHGNADGLLTYKANHFFQGSLINIILKTEHLPDKEASNETDEFTF
jgi:hypothetical protein